MTKNFSINSSESKTAMWAALPEKNVCMYTNKAIMISLMAYAVVNADIYL